MKKRNRTLMKLLSWLGSLSAFSPREEGMAHTKGSSTLLAGFATLSALVLGATPVHADIIWDLTYEFSEAQQPDGTLRVILEDTADDTVRLTVDATLLGTTEFVSQLYLNVNPLLDPTFPALVITNNLGAGYSVKSIEQGVDAFQADGDGSYDIHIIFRTNEAGKLGTTEKAEFTIMGGDGFDSSDLEYLSAPGGGHGPFYVAAHVQGIGEDGQGSGWVTTPVPEASTMLLFGSGLLGVLGFARRKARSLVSR